MSIDHTHRVYSHILQMLSSEENPTPLLRLNKVVPFEHTEVYAKLEWYNPFGAIKDRVAANMIRDAESKGLLDREKQLVEPTSGNTGMGLAMLGNAKGYKLTTPLSTQIPAEKRVMLRFAGADVEELEDTLCPAPGAPEGAIARAMDHAEKPEYVMLNQYENEANFEAHIDSTGPEIWKQTQGRITHFVAATGTCGTVTGNGRFLKGRNDTIQVIAVHPEEGHDIPGVRSLRQLKQTKLFKPEEYDQILEVTNRDAYDMCLRLNRQESVIAGPSAALALVGALRGVPDEPGNVAVVIFADNIYKYASSFEKHFPDFQVVGGTTSPKEPSRQEQLFERLVSNARGAHTTVEVEGLKGELEGDNKPLVVDVRPADVFQAQHLPGAVNLPLAELESRCHELKHHGEQSIVTVCTRGNASITGLLLLQSLGYHGVRSLNGGTLAWADAGLPTVP